MSEGLDPSVLEKIRQAQTVRGIPPSQPFVPYCNIGDLIQQQACQSPSKTFLVVRDEERTIRETVSYAQLLSTTNRAANYIKDGLGLEVGDRLATVMYNHRLAVEVILAALKVGIAVVPIDPDLDDAQLVARLEASGVKALFVRVEYMDRVGPIAKQILPVDSIVQVGGRDYGFPMYENEMARCDKHLRQLPNVEIQSDALIVYPSKERALDSAVLLSHYNLLASAYGISKWHRFSPEDRTMGVLPIHQSSEIVSSLLTPLYFGGSTVLTRAFTIDPFWKTVAEEEATCLTLLPSLLEVLLEQDAHLKPGEFSRLSHVICGGDPCPIEIGGRFEERFRIPLIPGYSLSESTSFTAFLPLDLPDNDRRRWMGTHGAPCIGVPIDSNEMAIHDSEGSPQGPNRRGEIVIRGHNIMQGYVGNPDKTRSAFQNGWLRTGDEGFLVYDEGDRPFFFLTQKIEGEASPSDYPIDQKEG